MISKPGRITITENSICVTEFHFNNPCVNDDVVMDALLWSMSKIKKEIKKRRWQHKSRTKEFNTKMKMLLDE